MNNQNNPKVGIATIVKSKGLILFGQRISSLGNGTLAFPGGKLEKFESFFDCAKRELYEETELMEGKDVKYLSKYPIAVTNDIFEEENENYITLFLEAEQISSKIPKVKERDKCKYWKYFLWEDIVNGNYRQLFLPVQNLIKQNYEPYL